MPYKTSFHNSTGESEQLAIQYDRAAKRQECKIIDFFLRNPTGKFTPSEILAILFSDTKPPITSIRRAMTNLTDKGQLEMLDERAKGPYGRPEHYWQVDEVFYRCEMRQSEMIRKDSQRLRQRNIFSPDGLD